MGAQSPLRDALGRRERQIMDIVHRLGRVSVADVRRELDQAPSYSGVRGMLAHLERKGYLAHERDRSRYLYRATAPAAQVRTRALRHLLHVFFGGSPSRAVAALLDLPARGMSEEELERIAELVRRARTEGR
jgi:BlaI family penicillinase repressor